MLILVAIGGYFFAQEQERHWREQIGSELTAVAQLKTEQILLWRQERLSDANYLVENTFLIQAIADWMESQDEKEKDLIRTNLTLWKNHYPYQDILLIDTDGNIMISVNNIVKKVEGAALSTLPSAFAENKAVFVDFHIYEGGYTPHLDVVAPLSITKNNMRKPVAAVILCMDPEYVIYPLIKYWPSPSETAETLLIRREGDEALFLNELRHHANTAMNLRIPLSQKDIPAVAAVMGHEGYFEGKDYRGIKVIAVIRNVPDSPWYLIAKQDSDEAFAELRFNTLLITGISGILVIILLGLGALLWQRRQRLTLEALYNSEIERKALTQHYEYLVKYANDVILLTREDSTFAEVNDRALELYGYTREEFSKLTVEDLIAPEDMPNRLKRKQAVGEQGSIRTEALHRKKDGSIFPIELSIKAFYVEDIYYQQAIIRDITDRKKAEEELRYSESFLKSIVENSPYAMCITDGDGITIQVNQAFRDTFNVSTEEVTGNYNILDDKIIEEQGLLNLVRSVFINGETVHFTVKYELSKLTVLTMKGIRNLVLDTTISAVRDDKGRITNTIIQYIDMTERIRIEEQLKLVNRLYALLSDVNQTIVRIKDVNKLFADICMIAVEKGQFTMAWIGSAGRVKGEMNPIAHYGHDDGYLKAIPEVRKSYPDHKGPTDIALMEGVVVACNDIETDARMLPWRAEALKRGYRSMAAVPLKRKGVIVGNFTLYADRQESFTDAEIALLNEIGTDISYAIDSIETEKERIRIEKELRRSEEKLTKIFNTAPAGIGIGENHIIKEANHRLCEITGYTREELIGTSAITLHLSPGEYDNFRRDMYRQIAEKNIFTGETKWKCKNGEVIDILITATRLDSPDSIPGIVFTVANITEKKLVEEERQKMGKLESIGILAGGIAHDFNNILTAILGNINLARLNTKPDSDIYDMLVESEKASIRAQSLTQQLLTFARGGTPVKKIVSMAELVKETASFALRGSNVRCYFEIPDDLWKAEIDSGQVSQVISNLIINAQQAMPDGGVIDIECGNISLTKTHKFSKKLPLKEGNYIEIAIKDHGIGIPEEHLDKIFDPYFTTKQTGSGLGLAIVYSIIRNHGGHISVQSKVGKGTTFYVYLPALNVNVRSKEAEKKQLPLEKGRILVMDDEEAVKNVARHMLTYLGYNDIVFASDGAEAITLYRKAMETGKPFTAVILDLTIPAGMGGQETIRELLKIDPSVKAIVSSGYTNEKIITEFRKYGFSGIVTKPYTIEQLSDTLNEVTRKARREQ